MGENPNSTTTKEADNYIGEWLQLFPKEAEDTLARKLQHVPREEEQQYIGEWLQHLPQEATWVINSRQEDNLGCLFQQEVEEPPSGWYQEPPKGAQAGDVKPQFEGWGKEHPQGAESYQSGALPRPMKLAENFEDWRQKYAPTLPGHYKTDTLPHPRKVPQSFQGVKLRQHRKPAEHYKRWSLQLPLTQPQRPSTSRLSGNFSGAPLQQPYPQPQQPSGEDFRLSAPNYSTAEGRDVALWGLRRGESLEEDDQAMEGLEATQGDAGGAAPSSDQLSCSLHQLMFAEETIL